MAPFVAGPTPTPNTLPLPLTPLPPRYAIAYMAPFVAGAALLQPDRLSMFLAVGEIRGDTGEM